jgi:hypothetical protein
LYESLFDWCADVGIKVACEAIAVIVTEAGQQSAVIVAALFIFSAPIVFCPPPGAVL